jgi:integrase
MKKQPNRAKITPDLIDTIQPREKIFDVNDAEVKGFMLRVRPNGDKSYFLRYRNASGLNRTYKIANTIEFTPRRARDEAIKLLGAIKNGEDPSDKKRVKKKEASDKRASPTLRQFLDNDYKNYVIAHSRSGDKSYKLLLSAATNLLDMKLQSITAKDVDSWKTARLTAVTKPTIDRYSAGLRSAFNKAVDWQLIQTNPFAHVKSFRVDNARVRFLSSDEEARLRVALDTRENARRVDRDSGNKFRQERGYELLPEFGTYTDHLKPMTLLAMQTGLRQGELFKLSWESVDIDGGLLTVLAKTSKRDMTRHIPLSSESKSILSAWRNQTSDKGLVFAGKQGKEFVGIKTSWHKILLDAEIMDFHWHDLRHHFASRLVQAGVDLNTVRELLGHSDIKMTLRYAHLAPEHKKAAIDKAFG